MFEVKVSFLFECRRYMPGELLADTHLAVVKRSQFVKRVEPPKKKLEVPSASNTSEKATTAPAKAVPPPKAPVKAPVVIVKPIMSKPSAPKVGASEV